MLMVATCLSMAALFLNPVGWRQVAYSLDTMFGQPLGVSAVDEWHPLLLGGGHGVSLVAVLGCVLLILLLRTRSLHLDEALLLVGAAWMATSHQRMLFVFGIFAAPVLARLLAPAPDRSQDSPRPRLNAALLVTSAVLALLCFPSAAALKDQVAAGSPVGAVRFLEAHPIRGNMLNDYTYGGYLIWAAPEHPVFVDGRADVFEWTGVLQEFASWSGLSEDPRKLLDRHATLSAS